MTDQHITLKPVAELNRSAFLDALNTAYSDYFISIYLSRESFAHMVRRESVVLEHSMAALVDGRIVGMGLLGVRGQRGWIGGMGVIPDYRRRGIGRQIMRHLIAAGRALGLHTLQLEVITQNHAAHQLYQSSGFHTRRRLVVLSCSGAPPDRERAHATPGVVVRPERPAALLEHLEALPAAARPWQREMAAHHAVLSHLRGFAAHSRETGLVAGVCLYQGSGHYKDIADLSAATRQIGAALVAYLLRQFPASHFTYLNVAEDDPQLPGLKQAGFREVLSQFEMFLPLNQEAAT